MREHYTFVAGRPEPWMADRNCTDIKVDRFFPTVHNHIDTQLKECCEACPVRKECFWYGLHEQWGMWGGFSNRQRLLMRNGHKKFPAFAMAE
jgi:hypothetical protein